MLVVVPRARADDEAAKHLFEKAETAYKLGRYAEAIKLYETAYREMPVAPFLFNVAQAHRMQYTIDHKPFHLRKALALYRTYLREAKEGNRAVVKRLIDELKALLAAVEERAEDRSRPGKLVLRGTLGAGVKIDGQPVGSLPLQREVPPGTHFILVEKAGYRSWHSSVTVAAGAKIEVPVSLATVSASARPLYKKWWFWTVIGVAVAGGVGAGVGIHLATREGASNLPEIDLR